MAELPMNTTQNGTTPRLERRFGLLQATALNMSNMVGIGPFITIPVLMTALGGPQAMLGWLVALVVALADGLIWSELGAAKPGSGGSYVYLLEAFGRLRYGRIMAFLFIWQFILSGPLEIASGYIGFAQYFKYLWPGISNIESLLVAGAVGIVNIFLLYRQITSIGRITVSLWVGTLLTTGAVIVTGLAHFDAKLAFDFPPDAIHFSLGFLMGLGAASRIGVYDYLGYYDVCFIGDEVKDPGRVIPRSILISLVVVAALYILINLSIIGIVPWRSFVPAGDPPAPVVSLMMEKIYGTNIAKLFTLMVLWTAFGSCFALLLGYSRIPYAAARDGNFFRVFARLHPTQNFPHVSLVVIGLLAVVLHVSAADDGDRRPPDHPDSRAVHRSGGGGDTAAAYATRPAATISHVAVSAAGTGRPPGLGFPFRHYRSAATGLCDARLRGGHRWLHHLGEANPTLAV